MVVGFSFVLERESAIRYVIEVLQPFEERHSHTAGVYVQIGNDENVLFEQYLISGRCRWTIGSFSNNLEFKNKFELRLLLCYFKAIPLLEFVVRFLCELPSRVRQAQEYHKVHKEGLRLHICLHLEIR